MPPTCPPKFEDIALDDGLAAWTAGMDGLTQYWTAAYAALRPERINTLTIAGAPIDFHAGEPAIHAAVNRFAPGGDLAFYRALVAAGGGVLKGEQMLTFILIGPQNEVARQTGLLANIRDPEHTARYREFEDWFKHTQDIPGAFYLWIVEHLFRDNQLLHGQLEIAGERVDLGRIDCPLNLLPARPTTSRRPARSTHCKQQPAHPPTRCSAASPPADTSACS